MGGAGGVCVFGYANDSLIKTENFGGTIELADRVIEANLLGRPLRHHSLLGFN